MRVGDSTRLDVPAGVTLDPHGDICAMASGKRVLNVGAAGNAAFYRENGAEGWLHAALNQVATELHGLDLDGDEINVAADMGYSIVCGNCEDAKLDQTFDLIVMADVLEHVNNPGLALTNMLNHLDSGGQIVITTPNATFLGNVVNALLRRGPNVFWDHVNLYTPENIQALCDRHGWQMGPTRMFSLNDRRSGAVRLKSLIVEMVGKVFPRLHSGFLCVISQKS
ncbi:MAG: class I SAM-dependent methyltransferase [Magnetovibrio sp.]|nr:class I SAM-dependent methyltransferase [Magnetovibrio sp.]